jgi:CheY-like chemotaxis protein
VLQRANTPRRGRLAQRRILIVEDEPYVRDVIAEYLERAGYVVDEAGSGVQALECMRSVMPDLVLLDLGLPVMSGPDFVAAVRQEPRLASAAVVVLSGQSDLADEAAHLGARASLAKPVDLDVLLAVVDRVSQT